MAGQIGCERSWTNHLSMETLALKLIVTPLLILAASLASRRWGEIVGGWFVGLPLTSGPVCFFLALDHGTGFAAAASLGSLAGAAAEAGFGFAYCAVARHHDWPIALATGSLAFGLAGLVFQLAALPLWPLVLAVCAALAAALYWMPRADGGCIAPLILPRWDLPARMAVATALVLSLTGLAPYVGARLSGLFATYPIFAAVLAAFSHRGREPAAATEVLRGLLTGLYAFTGFFAVLTMMIEPIGIAGGFGAATAAALVIQFCSWQILRRRA
jgi:hypothetical protein